MEAKKKEFVELLKSLRDYYGPYHDHKETTAWVATVAFVSICSVMLLTPGILRGLYKNWYNLLSVSVAFTLLSGLFFCFVFNQFRRREFANNTVIASTNIISKILDNDRLKLDLKKGEFNGTLLPKALIDEYMLIEGRRCVIGSEIVSYCILFVFYLGVLVKIMFLFYG
ncbi:MAG: hypothetical protein JXQ30_09850 [Spirochaetes bacterium]|nr:hypothetical protein [Spirochaetota bacterium]